MNTSVMNVVSAAMADEARDKVQAAFATIREQMPFLVTLSTEKRKALSKVGLKQVGFDDRCKPYMAAHPEFVPNYVDVAELEKDRALRQQLQPCLLGLKELLGSVEDTMMQLGSEIYRANLSFYEAVGSAAKRDLPGAEPVYQDLQTHFARSKGGTKSAKAKPESGGDGTGGGASG